MEAGSSVTMGKEKQVVRRLPKLQEFRDTVYAQAEKEYLQELMEVTEENISEACRISGLSQSRLYALLKKNAVSRSE